MTHRIVRGGKEVEFDEIREDVDEGEREGDSPVHTKGYYLEGELMWRDVEIKLKPAIIGATNG